MGDYVRVLIIDNFDSFTWNVAHGLAVAGARPEVRRADALTLEEIEADPPGLLVISPGPGRPEDASLSMAAIQRFAGRVPILGICLGMQCIAVAFGGRVDESGEPVHGKVSSVSHDGEGMFTGIASPVDVGRYHSLHVSSPPPGFAVQARVMGSGTIMAIRRADLRIAGVQFHPDSFLTPHGGEMLANAARGIL
jgi:anthranilate synthase/aminodeoxychorismate synthase-like glutamine amidotransferase